MPAWVNLPNSFTFLRLALTPWVVQEILTGNHLAALSIFFVAAVTDVLDGATARGMQCGTQFGAYFDPIADKCLMSGVFLALAMAGKMPWWLVILVFSRDLYILAGVGVIWKFTKVRQFPPSVWGKLSTFVQICTVVVSMTADAFPNFFLHQLSLAMLWVCAFFTAASGVHYTWRGVQIAHAD